MKLSLFTFSTQVCTFFLSFHLDSLQDRKRRTPRVLGSSDPGTTTTVAACLPMVCSCSPIRTVAITISSIWSCAFHDCHCHRRIVPLWRLCTRLSTQRSICVLNTRFLHNSLADQWRDSQPTSCTWCRAHQQLPFCLGRADEFQW